MSIRTRYAPDEVADLPVFWKGDVAVVGGGSAGSVAAVAAARAGARTLLIESGGHLGGTGTRVLDTFYGFYAPGGEGQRVIGGIGWEVCQALFDAGAAFERPNTYGAGTGVTYEPEALKVVWDEVVTGSGADLLLYGLVTATVQDGPILTGVVVETRSGPGLVRATTVVDASGDAEVAWRAGAAFDRSVDALRRQPATATFRVGGVSEPSAGSADLHRLMAQANAEGYDLPRREGSSHVTLLPGIRHTNLTRVMGLDLTDPWQLTQAELEGRRQVQEYMRFLTERAHGYSEAYLLNTSTRIGVRETRRLDGQYVLTRDDVVQARDFPDAIARCGAPVEDHSLGDATHWEYVGGGAEPSGQTYGIPYRSLLPNGVSQLIVAGRCLSATHEAHASVRSIGQCMAMGQAAGTAAALAVDSGLEPSELPYSQLQDALRSGGVLL